MAAGADLDALVQLGTRPWRIDVRGVTEDGDGTRETEDVLEPSEDTIDPPPVADEPAAATAVVEPASVESIEAERNVAIGPRKTKRSVSSTDWASSGVMLLRSTMITPRS